MSQPIPITADTGEEVTVEMALEQASRATALATDLAGALEEARELLIQVMAIAPGELEPPIRKEHGDITAAKRLERQTLEQKYALARMTARLSIRKVHDLEGKVEILEHHRKNSDDMPRPRCVRRTGDQSLELTFSSCRLAGVFEQFIEEGQA